MPDFNPALLRRMLLLRQYPLFAGADLDELATMGENVVATHFPAGAVVAPEGKRLRALQLVIDGRIETPSERWGPREVFGALEVAATRELAVPAIATMPTTTFELLATDFDDVLEDNFGVMLSTLRVLATQMVERPRTRRRSAAMPVRGPLGLVERLIVLRNLLPFASARVQALATLAHDSQEVRYPAGSHLLRAGNPALDGLVIVEGTVRASVKGRIDDAGPGAAFGHLEALAQLSMTETVEALTDVRALRSPAPAVLDVLEDHPDVGLAMIAAFAGALLDARHDSN